LLIKAEAVFSVFDFVKAIAAVTGDRFGVELMMKSV